MTFRVSDHAASELERRSIPRQLLDELLSGPQQVVAASGGRKAYQSKITFAGSRIMLLRAIVDDREDPPAVVTVYRTSKIDKYWSQS